MIPGLYLDKTVLYKTKDPIAMGKGWSFQKLVLQQLDIHVQKMYRYSYLSDTQKNQLQIDHISQCERQK